MIVVIPMAGADTAFREHGFTYCKPLIEIQGQTLIERVWDRLKSLPAEVYVFVVRREDAQRFHLQEVLKLIVPDARVVVVDGETAGAACTALLAIESIRPDSELVVVNGDQILECDLGEIVSTFRQRMLDAATIVFDSIHPRWSFVRVDSNGFVVEAAEKRPISRWATAGFYYFRRGVDFIEAAEEMMRKDAHVKGRFYVCPTFNELILKHRRIGVWEIHRDSYISLAMPENVRDYERTLGNRNTSGEMAPHK